MDYYLKQLAGGDFGTSIVTRKPVLDEFMTLFPATAELSICAMIIAVFFGSAGRDDCCHPPWFCL